GIKTDSVGNSYIAGGYIGKAIFGNDTLPSYSSRQYGIFIAKFDSNGNCKWAKAAWDTGGIAFEASEIIDIDKWGDVYTIGIISGGIYFGCDTLRPNPNSTFLVKLDSSGNCVWDKLVNNATAIALHVNRNGNSYLGCTYNSSASIGTCNVSGAGFFIVRLDSAGNCIWTETATGSSIPASIAIDYNGNCHITGDIIGNTSFGSTILTNPNGTISVLVAKLDVPTGTGEALENPNIFNIYPNPSAGGYTLQISASLLNSQLTIYDTQGRNIFQTKIVQENPQINIPSLAKGMYYVKLTTPQGQSIEKTIVQQ
ncbi:MAG TPA: T9SS type A sorting domain-containing protein, partial [Bacteroidia bacterium]|nr:T9SS type A sorting domain-containing protein [Bacteroidia bacterium]